MRGRLIYEIWFVPNFQRILNQILMSTDVKGIKKSEKQLRSFYIQSYWNCKKLLFVQLNLISKYYSGSSGKPLTKGRKITSMQSSKKLGWMESSAFYAFVSVFSAFWSKFRLSQYILGRTSAFALFPVFFEAFSAIPFVSRDEILLSFEKKSTKFIRDVV